MLCTNAVGEKEQAMVIGKAIKPRCFGRINRNDLPVDYHANKKAWMTSNLFEVYMRKLDAKMRRQNRNILMILENSREIYMKERFFPSGNSAAKTKPAGKGKESAPQSAAHDQSHHGLSTPRPLRTVTRRINLKIPRRSQRPEERISLRLQSQDQTLTLHLNQERICRRLHTGRYYWKWKPEDKS